MTQNMEALEDLKDLEKYIMSYARGDNNERAVSDAIYSIRKALTKREKVDVGGLKKQTIKEINDTLCSPLNCLEKAVLNRTIDHLHEQGFLSAPDKRKDDAIRALDEAYRAAVDFINETPCDPDITRDQERAWSKHLDAKESLNEHAQTIEGAQQDYFGELTAKARQAGEEAMVKFPQPNYVSLKIAEEAGEVVRGCVHYAEGRLDWQEVEGEIVQLMAMLYRLVNEGDHINGVYPPKEGAE